MALLDPGDPAALSATTRAAFADRYGEPPTTVARAPGRVNLIGEHTDYNGGLVLPVALPHATYAAARPRADELVRVSSHQQAEVWEGTLGELGPGSVDGWAGYAVGVLWALREAGHDVPGVDLLVDSRVPLGAGLSSSAALECSVGVALLDLLGVDPAEHDPALIDAAIRAETEVVGAPTGGMDQTVAVLGVAGAALLIDFDVARDEAGAARPGRPHAAGHRHPGQPRPHRRRLRVPARRLRERGPRPRRTDPARQRPWARSKRLTDDRVRRRARTSSPRSRG